MNNGLPLWRLTRLLISEKSATYTIKWSYTICQLEFEPCIFLVSTVQVVARSKKKKLERKGGWCQTISIVSAPNPTANSPMNQEKLWWQALTHLNLFHMFLQGFFLAGNHENKKISAIESWISWGWKKIEFVNFELKISGLVKCD